MKNNIELTYAVINMVVMLIMTIGGSTLFVINSINSKSNKQYLNEIEVLKEENTKLKENLTKVSGLPMKTNFKTDIEFLEYMIAFKIENIKTYRLKPLQMAQTTIIGDKEFASWSEETIMEVCNTLSPQYKRLLSAYFTETSLIEYVTEQVTAKLTSEILSANFTFKK